jgi:hypothetical protein
LAIARLRNAISTMRDLDESQANDRAIWWVDRAVAWLESSSPAALERLGRARQVVLDQLPWNWGALGRLFELAQADRAATGDLESLMDEPEDEADAGGPDAIAGLSAFRSRFERASRDIADEAILAERDRALEDSGGDPAHAPAVEERTHPHKPVAGEPGHLVVRHLYQSAVWTDRFGAVLPIGSMTSAHLVGVAGYLRWYADLLYEMDPTPKGDLKTISAWLIELPLWVAVENELYRRDAEPEPIGDLLAHLRAQGPVPWERKSGVPA